MTTSKKEFIQKRTRAQIQSKSVLLPAKDEKPSTSDQRLVGKKIRSQSAPINREEVKIIFLNLMHSIRPVYIFFAPIF